MQLYGPPPSYPGMKIPGLNAPIPSGAQWGMQYVHAMMMAGMLLCVACDNDGWDVVACCAVESMMLIVSCVCVTFAQVWWLGQGAC